MPYEQRTLSALRAFPNSFSGAAAKSPAASQEPQDPSLRHSAALKRPHWTVLNDTIPVFFIGRNNAGFWVARESEGRNGGIFLSKASAICFAKTESAPNGCALMLITEVVELDLAPQPD